MSSGAMNTLIGKLATLMGNEYKKFKGVRKQAEFLHRELSTIKTALDVMEHMDDLDSSTKEWRDHVREMSYDMANCVDDFMRQFGGADANVSFVSKTLRRLRTLRARHQIASQMDELITLAKQESKRRIRYNIDNCNSSSDNVPIDQRITAIYKEAAGLVGIDAPREEVTNWLTDTKRKLKVVSIVGFGGLGKTTLAKQVYDKIGGQFSCSSFVSVSQRPDLLGFLNGLHKNLRNGLSSSGAQTVEEAINCLREHLKDKRYLIVVDDIWDVPTWNIISCAFPENNNGSRVIVTTRLENVAREACLGDLQCIYRMKPLEDQHSRRLFCNRIFGSEDGCPSHFEDVSHAILKKCGGLPLAIITIASLLSSRVSSRNDWEGIIKSLGSHFASDPTLEGMMSILNLSYKHLPLHLRTCFLYLGMYPEDCEIGKDDLIRQWIAEDFVVASSADALEDVAESYFNELLNKSLIQPGKTVGRDVVSCRVHDMIRDLIISKCAEANFIKMAYNSQDMIKLRDCKLKVRRLFVSSSTKGAANGAVSRTIGTSLSQVRSIVSFGEFPHSTPCLFFKYLRVLFIENWCTTVDLKAISLLFQLRYLKVIANMKHPSKFEGLVHLETLELASSISSNVVKLPRLSHLIAQGQLPKGIGNLKLLRTLKGFDLRESSSEDIKGLGELTNLRELFIVIEDTIDDALVSSIEKLRNLRHLRVYYNWYLRNDSLLSLSNPPLHIKTLRLDGIVITRIPKWIADLRCLEHLELFVDETSTDDFRLIGELPSLVELKLLVLHFARNGVIILRTGLFSALEYFESQFQEESHQLHSPEDDVMAHLCFDVGTMPKLQKLKLCLSQKHWGGATPVGMENLLGLKQINVVFAYCGNADIGEVDRRAESAFMHALQAHPNRPSFNI